MLVLMKVTGTIGSRLMESPKIATTQILLLEAAPPAPLLMAVEVAMVRQPKERTGKDSNMGGADGGTAGMGYSKENIEPKKED